MRTVPRFEALEDRRMLSGDGWLISSVVDGLGGGRFTYDVAQDPAGNTYVTGVFAITMTIGSETLHTDDINQDLFVAKLDPHGELLWAHGFGDSEENWGFGIDVGNDGSAYVTGSFKDTITFPTAAGRITLTSAGGNDAVVFKLDTAGNVLWAQRAGSAQQDSGGAVAVADDGSVYVSGGFNETADFGADTLFKSGNTGFLTKMSTETGEFIWARTTPEGGAQGARDVLLGPGGDVFTVGSNVARFDASGNMLWNIAGVYSNGAIYQDPSTKRTYLYTADYYTNGPGDVRKLDADTGATVWEKAVLVPEGANISSAAVDGAGNLYLTGWWHSGREQWRDSTTDFDPGPGTFYLTSSAVFLRTDDLFLLKLNPAGEFVSARRMGDTSQGPSRKEFHTTAGYDVEVDPAGNVFVGGYFRGGPREFDLGMSTVVQAIYADNTQVFALKMTQDLGAISGRVFTDTDGDGTPGTGEPWVVGATVYLDQNKNGVHDPSEVSVTSGDFGEYAFTHVSAGTYTVRQVVPTGLAASAPVGGAYTVTLAVDQFLGDRDFGTTMSPAGNATPVVTSLVADPASVIWPGAFTLTAAGVNDSDGTVMRVAFYEGDLWLGTDEDGSDGWHFSADTANWRLGEHTLVARAQDNQGAWSELVSTVGTLRYGTIHDTAPPVSLLSVSPVAEAGGTTHVFAVTYTDDVLVNVLTLGDADIQVRGPGLFQQQATLLSVDDPANGPERTAFYQITAPGGEWDAADSGTYEIWMMPLQVGDLDNNYARFERLGTFVVTIDPSQVGEVTAEPTAVISDDRFEMIDGHLALRLHRSLEGTAEPNLTVLITVPDTSFSPHENPLEIAVSLQVSPWQNPNQNPNQHLDVNHDGRITAHDALLIINELNAQKAGVMRLVPTGAHVFGAFRDVNGDQHLSPSDALGVINGLARQESSFDGGEGEADTTGPGSHHGGTPFATSNMLIRAGDGVFATWDEREDKTPAKPAQTLANTETHNRVEPPIGVELRKVLVDDEVWAELECQWELVDPEDLLFAVLDADMIEV